MRKRGFKNASIGYDRRFRQEFVAGMMAAGFTVNDIRQYYHVRTGGFRRIGERAKNGNFNYLHSSACEYCLSDVAAVERYDGTIAYEKTAPEQRIDLFDAAVFACCDMLERIKVAGKANRWKL